MKKWTKELLEESGYEMEKVIKIEDEKEARWLSRLGTKERSDE